MVSPAKTGKKRGRTNPNTTRSILMYPDVAIDQTRDRHGAPGVRRTGRAACSTVLPTTRSPPGVDAPTTPEPQCQPPTDSAAGDTTAQTRAHHLRHAPVNWLRGTPAG